MLNDVVSATGAFGWDEGNTQKINKNKSISKLFTITLKGAGKI